MLDERVNKWLSNPSLVDPLFDVLLWTSSGIACVSATVKTDATGNGRD